MLHDWLHAKDIVMQFKNQLEAKLMKDVALETIEKQVIDDLFDFYEYLGTVIKW